MLLSPYVTYQGALFAQTGGLGLPPWAWLLIVILVIVIVWWLIVRSANHERQIEATHTTTAEPSTPSEPDDLAILEGIGPKVKSTLAGAGITTFQALSETSADRLKEILEAAGYAYMDPTTWPEQAGLLAEGKTEAFQKLADELKGGRRAE